MAALSFDYRALVIALVGVSLFWLLWSMRGRARSVLFFSNVSGFRKSGRLLVWWMRLPQVLMGLALVFFVVAFVDPHFYVKKDGVKERVPPVPVEGIAIYLVLDKSGSMAEFVEIQVEEGRRRGLSKMEWMKEVTAEFVRGRPSDMIGVVSFARQADILTPLTIDHEAVQEALKGVDKVSDKRLDGTAIGYAIYKTANLIAATKHYARDLKGKAAYEIKNGVIVLVTDGFQDPNPLDYGKHMRTIGVEEAAAYAKEQGVRLYVINVEPKMNTRQFAPHRKVMQRAAEETGGRFFQINSGQPLSEIYTEINTLEKSKLPGGGSNGVSYDRFSLYPYLIGVGMLALFLSVLLSTTLARRVP